jgi:cytochrome c
MRRFLIALTLAFPMMSHAQADTLHDAVQKGDVAALTAALNSGADVNKTTRGATPLFWAATGGHLEAAKLLINHGADVNAKSRFGTPLMVAAAKKNPEMMNLLLASRAIPDADVNSQTALHVAAERGCLACVKILIDAGANVNAQHKSGSGDAARIATPLHLAIIGEHQAVADYMLSHGIKFPLPDPISTKLASADVGKGRAYFESNCGVCHHINPEYGARSGPNLWNVVGRDKASTNYSLYSKTLLGLAGNWTIEDLNAFLSGPTLTTPGTKMQVQGAPIEAHRVNLIAYLRTLSDDPVPLP